MMRASMHMIYLRFAKKLIKRLKLIKKDHYWFIAHQVLLAHQLLLLHIYVSSRKYRIGTTHLPSQIILMASIVIYVRI